MADVKRQQYMMDVIPQPKTGTASVLVFDKKGPFVMIQGEGSNDYLCGTCKNVICRGVERGRIVALVFKCPQCGSFNRVKGT